MVLQVAEDGLLIPRDWLSEAQRYDLSREGGRLVIVPVAAATPEPATSGLARADAAVSIWDLDKNPVDPGTTDASVRHDEFAYGRSSGEAS